MPSINVSTSYPEDLYLKLQETATKLDISFCAAVGHQLALSYGLNPADFIKKRYKAKYKNKAQSTYALNKIEAIELPVPNCFAEFEKNKVRPIWHYIAVTMPGSRRYCVYTDESGTLRERPYTSAEIEQLKAWANKYAIREE